MKKLLASAVAVSLLGVGVATAGMSVQPNKNLSGSIKIDGSSTVYPITEAVAEEFKKAVPKVNVTVGVSGTGGGFKKFAIGETDISDASRPIKKEEHAKATESYIEYIELPVAYDGLSFVVNPKNTWVNNLTVDEIKKIYKEGSTVKTWKDVRPSWPDKPIKMFSPGTDSGTFDYFKEVVVGDKGNVRSDMSVSEDDNVLVNGVVGDESAIGFFGCAYYFENKEKLKVVPIDNGKGAITPSHDTVENGTYAPFSRPLFIYVNKKSIDRPEVKSFVEFYLAQAPELVDEVGYIPLPKSVYAKATANFKAKKTGTQYLDDKGNKRSGPVTEVYK